MSKKQVIIQSFNPKFSILRLTSNSPQEGYYYQPHVWEPPTDFYETDDQYVIRIEIAGMKEQDFDIFYENHTIKIRGVRYESPDHKAFHQMEIRFGEFYTEFRLPTDILPEEIFAQYQNGFLIVSIPKGL